MLYIAHHTLQTCFVWSASYLSQHLIYLTWSVVWGWGCLLAMDVETEIDKVKKHL